MRHRTHDEAGRFFTTERIGETRELTPEGFLLCRNVPIARTGELLYKPEEIGLEGGAEGIVRVTRGTDVLFDPKTIASFEGKDLVNDHPDDDVTPATWKDVSVGTTHNVRPGEGPFADCLVADLLVKDPNAIDLIEEGKVEISCGYDAEYQQDGPGIGRQTQIIGNHVALVDSGRCGSRCSIGDAAMATKKRSFKDRIMAAFKARDADEMEKVVDEMAEEKEGGADTHVHVHLPGGEGQGKEDTKDEGEQTAPTDPLAALSAKLDALTEAVSKMGAAEAAETQQSLDADEDDEKTEDSDEEEDEKKTKDAMPKDLLSRVEILNPGQKVKTADGKVSAKTLDSVKRKALSAAFEKHGDLVKPFLFGKTCDALTGATLDAAFIGASEMVRQANNTKGNVRTSVSTKDFGRAPVSPADLNKRAQEIWKRS